MGKYLVTFNVHLLAYFDDGDSNGAEQTREREIECAPDDLQQRIVAKQEPGLLIPQNEQS
jgi:hypothetical protein